MSEDAPESPPGGDEPQPLSLRDAEVAPPRKTLAEILDGLPVEPGVYIMKDARGKVIYIGKAAVLRNRVRQYFQPATGDSRDFVPLLEGIVADIETVVTSNEKEALLLENTLIKQHQPRFNVNLKDDKNFLVLRLDPKAEWPRLEVVRRLGDDGAHYFGPYHSATSCREALRVVNRHFQLRTCTDHVLHNRRRPCLQYQIKRCPAPCVLPVAREQYDEQVRDVRLFLDGKSDELMARLAGRMKEAAARTDFEIAADIRDQIRALEVTLEEQQVVSADFVDQDVVGFFRDGVALEIVVMSIRAGKLSGNRAFSFTGQEFPDAELISSFVGLYYDMGASVPDEVLLPVEIEDAALKAEWLTERRAAAGGRKKRVEVCVPQRGDRRKLIELARKNAAASFATRRNARADSELALGKLQTPAEAAAAAAHDRVLRRLAPAGVRDGGVDGRVRRRAARKRRATARTRCARPRRRARRATTTSRRCTRCCRAGSGAREAGRRDSWKLPDLIVVDGGKGQLGMALAAARDVGISVGPGGELLDRRAREGARGRGRARRRAARRRAACRRATRRRAARRRATRRRAACRRAARRRRAGPCRARRCRGDTGDARRARQEIGGQEVCGQEVGGQETRSRLPAAREGRDPDSPEQRGDVRAAGVARRGAPLRGQLPPRPAPPADAALGAF